MSSSACSLVACGFNTMIIQASRPEKKLKAHRGGGGLREMPSSVDLEYAHEGPPRETPRQGHRLSCTGLCRMVIELSPHGPCSSSVFTLLPWFLPVSPAIHFHPM